MRSLNTNKVAGEVVVPGKLLKAGITEIAQSLQRVGHLVTFHNLPR